MSKNIEIVRDKKIGELARNECASCNQSTNHEILANIDEVGKELLQSHYWFYWTDSFQIVQCKGCDSLSFREVYTDSQSYDHRYTGVHGEFDTFDLETVKTHACQFNKRPIMDNFDLLPESIQSIYRETNSALLIDSTILCGIGIRTIIEMICQHKKTGRGNLEKKINILVTQGVLTADSAEILHKLRLMGNLAAHEAIAHDRQKLELAMNIVNNLLSATYILPTLAQRAFSVESNIDAKKPTDPATQV